MGGVKNAIINYAEKHGLDVQYVMDNVSLATLVDEYSDNASAQPTVLPNSVPWMTIESYIKTSCNCLTNVTLHFERSEDARQLTVRWTDQGVANGNTIEIKAVHNRVAYEISCYTQVSSSIKHIKAAAQKQGFDDIGIVCTQMITGTIARRHIAAMEADWHAEAAAENAAIDAAADAQATDQGNIGTFSGCDSI